MKKKGFTLIELLAVIVVLAIIALIATPIVTRVISSSKDSANKISASSFASEANKYVIEERLSGNIKNGNIFDEVSKRMNGKKPISGVVYADDNGNIALALVFDDKCYTKKYGSDEIKTTDINECHAPVDYLALGNTGNDTEATFFNGPIKKSSVEKIVFVNSNLVPTDAIGKWNASASGEGDVVAWYKDEDNNNLYEVYIGGKNGVKANPNSRKLFNYFINLTYIDLEYLDTSSVTNMQVMFQYCSNLMILDLSNFDTSKVTDMSGMFNQCSKLTELNVSNFDTSNVTNMRIMFQRCSKLIELDISNFDTSKVIDMSYMFNRCSNLSTLDVSNFNTSSVTNMRTMFQNCSKLTELDVSNFDTSKVTDMHYMFSLLNVKSLDLSNFDTSKVTDMSYMFNECNNLESLDLKNFNTKLVTNMSYMFENCYKLTDLDLASFETNKLENMEHMFNGSSKLANINFSKATFNTITKYDKMFGGCGLTSITVKDDDAKTFIDARLKDSSINIEATKVS